MLDQDDEPHPAHCLLELADCDVSEGALGDEGCLMVSAIEPGSCKPTLGGVAPASATDKT